MEHVASPSRVAYTSYMQYGDFLPFFHGEKFSKFEQIINSHLKR